MRFHKEKKHVSTQEKNTFPHQNLPSGEKLALTSKAQKKQ
jgi:hypothetical protein